MSVLYVIAGIVILFVSTMALKYYILLKQVLHEAAVPPELDTEIRKYVK